MMTTLEVIFLVMVFLLITIVGTVLFFTTVHDLKDNYWWWLVAFFALWILALILIFTVQSDLKARVRALFKRSREDKACRPPNQVCRESLNRNADDFQAQLKACDQESQTSPCTEEIIHACGQMIKQVAPQAQKQFEEFRVTGKTSELLNVCNAVATST